MEWIYGQIVGEFPTTSLATVYKTIALLKGAGEMLELGFADGSNRYDGKRPYPHPHLICTRCGEIRDLEAPALSEMIRQACQDIGYQITGHRLDFYGLCPRCQIDWPPSRKLGAFPGIARHPPDGRKRPANVLAQAFGKAFARVP